MLAVKLKMNGLTWGLNKEGIHLNRSERKK